MEEKKVTSSIDYLNYPIWNLFGYWGFGRGGRAPRQGNAAVLISAAPQTPPGATPQSGGSVPVFPGCVPLMFFAGGFPCGR